MVLQKGLSEVQRMPFIRTQKLVYNDAGKIVSGSAAIVDVSYVASAEKYKS